MNLSTRNVATQFPEWTLGHCRAYRAGALAGLRGAPIAEGHNYEPDDDDLEDDDLTLYFFRGYADAVGPDVESEEWWDEISDWSISYLWWE